MADVVDGVKPVVSRQIIADVFIAELGTSGDHALVVGHNLICNREHAAHQNVILDSLFHTGKHAAHLRVETVAHEGNAVRVDIGTRDEEIDAAADVHDLLKHDFG